MLPNYDEQYVARLFDQMGPSYDVVNLISSFGFSEIWRAQCVSNLSIGQGAIVADLMSGSGECWSYVNRRTGLNGRIVSVDFSPVMCSRQKRRLDHLGGSTIEIRCENALSLGLSDRSVDFIVSAFGLKTFSTASLPRLAAEAFRVLRDGGACSFLEISLPDLIFLRFLYRFYLKFVIPLIGRIFLKNIECYQMLGVYTEAFGSCARVVKQFQDAGFRVVVKTHFFGCASSIVATKICI